MPCWGAMGLVRGSRASGTATPPRAVAAARKTILELGRRAPDASAFRRALRPVLACLLPFDSYCINTADPATLLVTGSVGDGLPADKAGRLFEIEYLVPDVSKLAELAVRGANVAILGDETDHRPETSARMRDVLLPAGHAHELRCALRLGRSCWGYLHLFRTHDRPDFQARDAELIRALSADIALGLRIGVLRPPTGGTTPDGPGLLLFSADGAGVDGMNAAASQWLAELGAGPAEPWPHAVLAVAQRARIAADGPHTAACRVQTRAGEWLSVHGSQIGGRVALVLEKARPQEIAPVILLAYELTRREGTVIQLLLRGMSNSEIAQALELSTYTVKDHLKSIFRKSGTQSRAELAARIFAEQYAPRIAQRTELIGTGWFAD